MLKPRQRLATARPIRPKPTIPTTVSWRRPCSRVPQPPSEPAIVLDEPMRRRGHQRQGMIGHGVVVGAEGHRHGHAVAAWPRPRRRDRSRHRRRATTFSAGAARTRARCRARSRPRRDHAVQLLDQLGLGQGCGRARSSAPRSRPRSAAPDSAAIGRKHGHRAQHRTGPGRRHRAQLAHLGLGARRVRARRGTQAAWAELTVRREGRLAGEHLAEHQHARLVLGRHQLETQAAGLGRQRVADMRCAKSSIASRCPGRSAARR